MTAMAVAQPPGSSSVSEILAGHDRALIRDLSDYLRKHPKADDRDQAFAALFNKAIEHDWFSETEDMAQRYLEDEPDGPVKALAQIIITMGRAQAGQYKTALERYKQLMQGLGKTDQEEFAASFTETFATSATAAAEFPVARQVYQTLQERFPDSPTVRDKAAKELGRLDKVGRPAPAFEAHDLMGKAVTIESLRGKYVLVDFWPTWCAPYVAELPRLQEAYRKHHGSGVGIGSVSRGGARPAVVD